MRSIMILPKYTASYSWDSSLAQAGGNLDKAAEGLADMAKDLELED